MSSPRYGLTLFVTGATPRSMRAIANLHGFCQRELKDNYELEVVDLYQNPERAQPANIIVAPTLVRHSPQPVKLFLGDMSDAERLKEIVQENV